MRVVIMLAVVATSVSAQGVERAGWLAGCWEMRSPGRVTMEMWMPPLGDLMVGGSRTIVGAAAREFEHLRIKARGDTLIYVALPSGQRETEFRAVEVTATTLAFENRAHDFPQRIVYRRVGADSVVARAEGPGPNNTTRGFDIPMRRSSCTSVDPVPAAPPPPTDTVLFDYKPSRDGRLLVSKGLGQNYEIYLVENGASRRMTDHPSPDYQPQWAPDGRSFVFVSGRDGHPEIYAMSLAGELRQLTRGTAPNSEPSFSPDGRSIAFRSERDGRPHVYVMNADGSNQRSLTRDSLAGFAPTWSPDGSRIAFSTTRSGRSEVYSMRADGSDQRLLATSTQGHSGAASWSPDGKTIVFWSSRDGNDEVYLMNADGSNPRNVTQTPARDLPLAWGADGTIIFRSNRDRPQNEAYAVKPDGTGLVRLTTTITKK